MIKLMKGQYFFYLSTLLRIIVITVMWHGLHNSVWSITKNCYIFFFSSAFRRKLYIIFMDFLFCYFVYNIWYNELQWNTQFAWCSIFNWNTICPWYISYVLYCIPNETDCVSKIKCRTFWAKWIYFVHERFRTEIEHQLCIFELGT